MLVESMTVTVCKNNDVDRTMSVLRGSMCVDKTKQKAAAPLPSQHHVA